MKTTQLPAVRFRSNQSASSGLHPTTTSQGGGSGAPTSFGLYTPVQSPSSSASSSSLLGSMVRSDSISSSISGTSSVSRKSSKRGHMCHVAVRIRPPSADELNQKDSVFQGSDNHYMYDTAVKRAIASAMDGIDATVFAYGQTSSGKTYSMMGYEEQPGIIPQAVDDVFTFISTQSGDKEYLLRVSYMEIYNETIRDLLNPEQTNLCIHEHRTKGVYVSPLKEEIVTSPKQLMKVIARGESNRSVGATNFNSHSSRSHTIFTLTIESRKRSDSASRVTSPSLIDLAGSEKATDDLERRKEGAYINKSLLALGNVICRITEETSGHIPYRDSKLTRILQSSLSGHSRISVIATLSEDLKHKLSETNSELEHERERLASSTSDSSPGLNDTERQHYEEQLHESRLVRTALKERIDHLTKLILTSSTISAKPLLDWSIAANDMDGKRSSVMLSAGLIPPADPVARASMMFDPRAGRSSRVPMSMAHAATKASSAREAAGSPRLLNRQLTDRVFIQKHIEEIDRRDVRISMLEGVSHLSRPRRKIWIRAPKLPELEIVVQEYRHKIEMLENKLEESNALVRFGEADHNEVSKQFQESTRKQPRLSRESLGSLLDLVKRETASMNKDQLRETGWEHRISEVAAALEHERAAGESSKATANQFADLEAELYSIQSRLRS
ncbi:hypothetical protein BSLG_003338 [Batrachochytrium salamandrivorans]|nr:hypothetical protein BSLG_003338 [Batrachochytrium salamandrivorans]